LPTSGNAKGTAEVLNYYRGGKRRNSLAIVRGNERLRQKPQNIESIKVEGTVRELLEKVDERKKLEEVAKSAQHPKILDRDAYKTFGRGIPENRQSRRTAGNAKFISLMSQAHSLT